MKKQKKELIQSIQESLATGNFALALEDTQSVITLDANDPQGYTLKGDIYLELGNYSKAEQEYERAIAIRPSEATTYYKLGRALETQGQKQAALDQYQTALSFSPDNIDYKGRVGALLYQIGEDRNNLNYISQGVALLEDYVEAGVAPADIKDLLAYAYLASARDQWVSDPNEKDLLLATSFEQIEESREIVQTAKSLISKANVALWEKVRELEGQFDQLTKKQYFGFNAFLKIPVIVGLLLLFFGATGQGILSLLGAGLYYLSQLQPGYVRNMRYLKAKFREPFALRRIAQFEHFLSHFTIFGSWTNVLFVSSLIRFGARCVGALIIIATLPYEIIKGFLLNYNFTELVNTLPILKKE